MLVSMDKSDTLWTGLRNLCNPETSKASLPCMPRMSCFSMFVTRSSTPRMVSGRSWEECFTSSKEFKIEIHEPTIRVDGDLAFSHCLSHATGKTMDGHDIDVWMRVTD